MTERSWGGIRLAATLAMVVAGLVMRPACGSAQSFPGFSLGTPAPGAAPNVGSLYATAPVVLDGVTLFHLAVPVNATNQQPVAVRANAVSMALDAVLATEERDGTMQTVYDPATLHVEIERDADAVVLEAVDARHHQGLPIVTVTNADAESALQSVDAVAEQWQAILQPALVRALEIRQPETLRRNTGTVLAVGGALALVTLIAYALGTLLSRRIEMLATEVEQHGADVEAERSHVDIPEDAASNTAHRQRLVGLLVRGLDPAKRLSFLRAMRFIGVAVLVLAWFGAITWASLQFSQTATFGNSLLRNGFAVAAIWTVALLIDRLLTITVDRLPTLWEMRAFGTPEEKQRQLLRAPTIARALGGFKSFVLVFIAGLATMTQVGIPVGSVVTIGGVAAIAVSLAAQNLIRDVVSGFLVLIEDQFVVGDYVTINGNVGTVERLTLRMVQIRNATGSLVTISHSAETSVINHSRNWSRVDYEISVDVTADVPLAISLLRQAIADLETDPEWKDAIVEPAEWIGIDALSRDGAVVRARIKTAPLRQYALKRELNARIDRAFGAAKIGYGAPPATPT